MAAGKRFKALTVATSDAQNAMTLWRDSFGLNLLATREAGDEVLAALWDLPASVIGPQYLLGEADSEHGQMHLVEVSTPADPIRAGAANTDYCCKNIDFYCTDMDTASQQLAAAGFPLKAPPSEFEADGMQIREAQLTGPDLTNISLMELGGANVPVNHTGFAGIGPVVTIVPSLADEQAFYDEILELDLCTQHRFAGPEFEKLIGLPPGAGLSLSVLGDSDNWFGRIELVEYEQVQGCDLYPHAVAPATGALHVSYVRSDASECAVRALARGHEVHRLGKRDSLCGAGECFRLRTPAGFQVLLFAPDQQAF